MQVIGQGYTTAALTPKESTLIIHRIGGWVGSTASLDDLEKRQVFYSWQKLDGRFCVINPTA